MAAHYGWAYDDFNTAIGWDHGVEATYLFWENFWSRKVDAYIFTAIGTCPQLTDANEKLEVGDIVNEMLVRMNVYLKAEESDSPMSSGFYDVAGFPKFEGNPEADKGLGTGHYRVLNKYRRKYSVLKVTAIRIGTIPDDTPFYQDRLNFYR